MSPPRAAPPRPLRIAVVNWQCRENPQAGGAEIHLHEIFGRLAARGHEGGAHRTPCSPGPLHVHELVPLWRRHGGRRHLGQLVVHASVLQVCGGHRGANGQKEKQAHQKGSHVWTDGWG